MTGPVPRTDPRARAGEQRSHRRWRPAFRCRAVLQLGGGHGHELDVVDVSDHGLRASAAGALPELAQGAVGTLRLSFPGARLERTARIVWSSVREVGLAFDGLPNLADGRAGPLVLDLSQVRADPRVALRLPATQAMRRRILPLCVLDGELVVASADLDDDNSLQVVARTFGMPVRPQRVDADALAATLRRVYGENRGLLEVAGGDDPVALCNELLFAAWLRRASDIHVSPEPDGVIVRFRVDGVLEVYRSVPRDLHPELLSRIKVLAGMDIAERRAPQDGRFTHTFTDGSSVDIRVATLPTNHGERATLRLLAIDTEGLTLDNLGLLADDLAACRTDLTRTHGLVLAVGPTGCGKTTTLFALLREIAQLRDAHIVAVQEPVEYDLPGVTQVEIDPSGKVTFASALRAIMRHDPDVIMIGEIRDLETASIAIKAALTGHLVLATLHTNSAASSITRLIDMGIEPYLLASTLRLVISQRLVRRLCAHCRRPGALPADAPTLFREVALPEHGYVPAGCVFCAGNGYRGRLGVFETIQSDATTAAMIRAGHDEAAIERHARSTGRRTLLEDAVLKLRDGATSYDMVLRSILH